MSPLETMKEKFDLELMSDADLAAYNKKRGFRTKEELQTGPLMDYEMQDITGRNKWLNLLYNPQADGGRAGYMGGGITGIRRPNALPPTGGPMAQGIMATRTGFKDGSKKKVPWYLWPYRRAQEWDKIIESAKERLFSSDDNDSNQ